MSKRPSRNAQRKMWSTCAFQRACHQTLCDGGSLKMVHRKSATTAMFIHQVCDVCHRFCTDVPCVDHKQAGYLASCVPGANAQQTCDLSFGSTLW